MDGESYNMDVDDLFGDSEHVTNLTIPAPPVKGLARRLDELSSSGCCQKIAWSKNGCVAYIAPDGYGVNLRVFARDPSTGKWDLGKDTPLEMPHTQEDFQFVHLSWSHLGNDLVVMNAAGHVMIFSMAMAIDRMAYMRAEVSQSEAEIDGVVGMHWLAILPYEQKNHIAWSASGKGDTWNFRVSTHVFKDAHHPAEGKASLIYLKRHGELKLRFQQHDNSWHEVSAILGPMLSTREPFTHAAFASNNDNTLLLAAHDVSGRLYMYRIEAKWNIPVPRPGHAPKPFEKPDLQVLEIAVKDNCYPKSSAMVNGDLNSGSESKIRIPAQLTHLSFLPVTPEKNDGTLPTILAIFSTPPNVVSIDQNQPQQSPFSIIVKWEVHQTQQNQLHSSLDKVTSKKKIVSSVSPRDVFLLKRQPDIVMHSVVLSFFSLWYHMVLSFCYSDGTIEFRKRSTLETIGPDYNAQTVTSLSQAGFSFSTLEPLLQVALSPNHCMAVCMQQDGTIKLRYMEYGYGSLASDEEDARHSAALAALVLQSSTAANQYFSSDDIFAVVGELSEKRKRDFIYLMFQGLNVNIDCGIDDNSNNHLMLLGRSPTFVKTLSAAHLLGLQGSVNRSVSSKIAWTILNIKYITQILTTIARMHGQIEKSPLRPEVVPQLIGICRWIVNFMVYMIDELMALGYKLKDLPQNSFDRPTLESRIQETNHSAILILLSSFPRMMMKLWANPLVWVARTAQHYVDKWPSPEVRRIYAPLHQAFSDVPFTFTNFDVLVSEAHMLVRNSYKRAGMTEAQRNEVERELILGRVPEVLVPAARRLLGDTLFKEDQEGGAFLDRKGMDPAKIIFFDTTWLGLHATDHSKEWFETHIVDVCQKMVIRGTGAQSHPASMMMRSSRDRSDSGAATGFANDDKKEKRKPQLRKCVRCGAYMEDVTQGMPGYAHHHISWLMGVAKHCVCGNSWMLTEEKRRAK
ncbi:uncharacterized protein BDR25DRAFT_302755 [Lindgomyces ingoldianus]|uniref:Uncharacterized protein n=1 Tax=Lindgomyces ingoldianus TaxID=673940 RepID=A0ACB6R073_9PLEO|nr:uncharacterized protein BDR25DRAFT_302755 [Lindgomyces ingoldianus]KAF2471912.1 hypothetical protein BDR25DRAFT_302755 [Lindgomyces ingoldianus]